MHYMYMNTNVLYIDRCFPCPRRSAAWLSFAKMSLIFTSSAMTC